MWGRQSPVAPAPGVLQQEPDALDVVAGVHDPALGDLQAGAPVRGHALQQAAQIVLDEIAEDLLHALPCPGLIELRPLRVHPLEHGVGVQGDHGRGKGPARPGLGDGLGAQARGVRHAVIQIPVEIIGPARALFSILPREKEIFNKKLFEN